MLTADLKVNGCLIGHLHLVNTGTQTRDDEKSIYIGEYHRIGGEGHGMCELIMEHERRDGAEELVARALLAVKAKGKRT